nr:MAG TPA: hypothetical protein [Caudoviricetes sp.]
MTFLQGIPCRALQGIFADPWLNRQKRYLYL